ncbi:kinase-like protein [Pilatotrama ljubarskyi]|nr:kinase-like protein [Pilatotrama ljubarskyi]
MNVISALLYGVLRRVRRFIVQYLLKRAAKRVEPGFKFRLGIRVNRLTSRLVLKEAHTVSTRAEAEALSIVAAHTSIPVPRLRYHWEEDEEGYLIMDYVEGEILQRVWRSLTDAQRLSVMRRLAGFVGELRSLSQPAPPPGSGLPRTGWIGSPLGHAFIDYCMTRGQDRLGPFANEREFYDWRMSRYSQFGEVDPPTGVRLAEMRRRMRDDHPVVFTHGDINGRNVLVRIHGDGPDDVEITALIDWEQAGWRPVYWESRKWIFIGPRTLGWLEFGLEEIGGEYAREVVYDRDLGEISAVVP